MKYDDQSRVEEKLNVQNPLLSLSRFIVEWNSREPYENYSKFTENINILNFL